MLLIAADIGNSTTKLAVGQSADMRFLSDQLVIQGDQPIAIDLPKESAFWSICSVSNPRCDRLCEWISLNRPDDSYRIIRESDVPIRSEVESRKTTGRDRLVAAWMAGTLANQDSPYIVIDAGTAVTIDKVSAKRVFLGGVIFPGASTQLRYLSAATDALPDLSNEQDDININEVMSEAIGRGTRMAILRGVFNAQLASIKSMVDSISNEQGVACEVFATGGGIERLRDFLPAHWNIVPNLVLQGAFAIGSDMIETLSSS